MAGTLDPLRTQVFNLRDVWIEIWTEVAGVKTTELTEYWTYVTDAVLSDRPTVKRNFQCGAMGRRLTTTSHDYTLSLSRFHTKYSDDFGIFPVSADDTYQILLIIINEQNPSLTETHTLKHCQLAGRSIRMNDLTNEVPTEWAVGEYTPPS